MTNLKQISRREFLRLLALSGTAVVLEACAPTPTLTPVPPTAMTTPLPPTRTPTANATSTPTATTISLPTATPTITLTPTPKSLGPFKPATYAQLPRWRGFNLLEKFDQSSPKTNTAFLAWDLDFMVEWGFDFVRLPLDYRIWTVSPGEYREQPLKEIDQLVSWARQRGIHVNLCLHRAPGYRIGSPEDVALWADGAEGDAARKEFTRQWQMFAARYRGIPSAELSFNLVNEPKGYKSVAQYVSIATEAIKAVRGEDPDRLIITDGGDVATLPLPELAALRIAHSFHCYEPSSLTHYMIPPWETFVTPIWPVLIPIVPYLYGDSPSKSAYKSRLTLRGVFAIAAELSMQVQKVSASADLLISADGKPVFRKMFKPGAGQGEWVQSTYRPEWNIYEAVYNKTYTASIPAGTREIQFDVVTGDWLAFSEIRISPYAGAPRNEVVINPTYDAFHVQQQQLVTLDATGNFVPDNPRANFGKELLMTLRINPWKQFQQTSGVGVHIGEFGCHNKTPHQVALAWMRDNLDMWQEAGWGWSMWNLRGSVGPVDSNRADVKYEDYKGHKIDRKMLDLLVQS